jgi:hypothetical protein
MRMRALVGIGFTSALGAGRTAGEIALDLPEPLSSYRSWHVIKEVSDMPLASWVLCRARIR